MKTFEARVVKGRLVLDAPSPFPDGAVVRLMVVDEGDEDVADLAGPKHAELRAALAKSETEFQAGLGHSLKDLAASRKIVTSRRAR